MLRAALRFARPTALLIVAALAAACVGSAGAAGSPSPKPIDKDQVVFRVSWDGGFVMPETILGRLPMIVVYADGRVITQGPQLLIYPGPLMPNLQERTLNADALARLVELARSSDLLKTIHYDFPGIADAADTVLEINVDGTSYRVSAYALADAGIDVASGDVLDDAAIDGRAALRAFIDTLMGLPESDFVDAAHPFEITGLRLFAGKAVIVPNSELPGEQPAIDWPLGDLATAGDPVTGGGVDLRCQVIAGNELAEILPLLNDANSLSTFRSEGELYSVIVRPLLPGEAGC